VRVNITVIISTGEGAKVLLDTLLLSSRDSRSYITIRASWR
jgi:hypothetical protein